MPVLPGPDAKVLGPVGSAHADWASSLAAAGSPVAEGAVAAMGAEAPMGVGMAAEVLRRVNRTRQAVSLVSQIIIRAYDEQALHAEACRHLVSFGGYLMAWVGVAEEAPERIVRPVAHAGLQPDFLAALRITWSNDLANRSPTSRAIQEQRPHVARNILKEPRYAVLRQEAQLNGYTATCALPLQFAQYGMGVLTIHSVEPDAFNAEEVSLLRELANDLASGVIGLRERARRQALEDRLMMVVDATDDAIIGCDTAGQVTDWNGGAVRLFGYSRDEAVGRRLADLIVPSDHWAEQEEVRVAVNRGERPRRFGTVRVCREGKVIRTSVMVSPIFAADGKVLGSTTVEHDLTAAHVAATGRRAAQMEEAEVARLKGIEAVRRTFISEASHELNTPLTPLRIHVEALQERADLTAAHREHVAVIARNVKRLCSLVEDMLEASRLETGRFKLATTDLPLAQLLQETVQGLEETASAAGVTLEVAPLPALRVTADRNRVVQVLYNYLTNAIAFTPSGGRVNVDARLEDGMATVTVTDTGLGLDAAQLRRLFQPFSRPHDGHSGPKGTGLGLFISKGIIEQHGGKTWATSPGPGKGSTFAFSLPLAPPAGAPPPMPRPPEPTETAPDAQQGMPAMSDDVVPAEASPVPEGPAAASPPLPA